MKKILYIPLILLAACETPVCCDQGPEYFTIAIFSEEGSDYLGQNSDELIELYYFENGIKQLLDPQLREVSDTTYLNALNVLFISNSVTRDFYLEAGDEIDTLYVEARNNKFRSIRLNGKEGIRSTNRLVSTRFILTK